MIFLKETKMSLLKELTIGCPDFHMHVLHFYLFVPENQNFKVGNPTYNR